jgi:hypothetical protein
MFAVVLILIFTGYPVAFSLGGTSLIFAAIAINMGILDWHFLLAMPERISDSCRTIHCWRFLFLSLWERCWRNRGSLKICSKPSATFRSWCAADSPSQSFCRHLAGRGYWSHRRIRGRHGYDDLFR